MALKLAPADQELIDRAHVDDQTATRFRVVLESLRAKYGDGAFDNWLSELTARITEDRLLVIVSPNVSNKTWLESEYLDEIIHLSSPWATSVRIVAPDWVQEVAAASSARPTPSLARATVNARSHEYETGVRAPRSRCLPKPTMPNDILRKQ